MNTIESEDTAQNRIVMLDALRGLAIAGILLLHHIEHFDFFKKPEVRPEWLIPIDKWFWDQAFLFFSGKAFALFSILFGFSYWIMYANAAKRGEAYFLRHIWRMAILISFGLLHLCFFRGDILIFYALLALPLVLTRYMNNVVILLVAGVLLLNPAGLYAVVSYLVSGEVFNFHLAYPKVNAAKIYAEGTFLDVLRSNFTAGYEVVRVWTWNVGRFAMIPGLFLVGVYLAKTERLRSGSLNFWYGVLFFSLVTWMLFDLAQSAGISQIDEKQAKRLLRSVVDSYTKLAMTFSILSAFVLIWRQREGKLYIAPLIAFGRMGLTNYVLMSAIGVALYYGWGLGLYKYCGSTVSLLIGIAILILQMRFSTYWLAHYPQGPLEGVWRYLTWIDKRSASA